MKTHKSHYFRTKIFKSFSIVFAISLLGSGFLLFGFSLPRISKAQLAYDAEYLYQSSQRIDEYLRQLNALCIQVSYSSFTREVLEKRYDGTTDIHLEYVHDETRISQLYQDSLRAFKGIDGVFMYNLSGFPYYYTATEDLNRDFKVQNEYWYKEINASADYGHIMFTGVHVPAQLKGTTTNYISLIRSVRSLSNHEIIGQAELIIRPSNFEKYLTDSATPSSADREMMLIDADGKVICSNHSYEVGDVFDPKTFSTVKTSDSNVQQLRTASSIMTFTRSPYSGWYLVQQKSSACMLSEFYNTVLIFTLFAIISFSIMIISSLIISHQITQPIARLSDGVKRIEQTNFITPILVEGNDEFAQLACSFNKMSLTLKEYIEKIQDIEAEKRSSDIIALQAQINPHFTLNTINTVKHLAMLQNANNIVSILDDFMIILAASYRFPNELIPIREEVHRIQAFIKIQDISSFGKIRISLDYDNAILDNLTMGLILQPLVENAIFHGIKAKISSHQLLAGTILISIKANNNCIIIHVKDDGIGMSQEQIDAAMSKKNPGIGIQNVNTRIKLRFGKEYGLSIASAPDHGCDVCVILPQISF